MVAAKSPFFSMQLQNRSALFSALAHPARLQILRHLAETRQCISGDISDLLPLSRTTINQHIRVLKDAGLIFDHLEGSKVVYCLDVVKMQQMEETLQVFLEEMHLPSDFTCTLYPRERKQKNALML